MLEHRALSLCFAFILSGCATAALAGPKDDLIAADKAFSAMSVTKGDPAAFLAYLADDGCLFGTGERPPVYGKAAYEKIFAGRSHDNDSKSILSWVPAEAEISADGTLGFTDGTWTYDGAPDAQGKREHATGHYLTTWKKDASGAWKVAADMGTTDPAPVKPK
jgi:ketosteroid isomerase-like protein